MTEQGDIFEAEGVRDAAASYSMAPVRAPQDSVPAGYQRSEVGVIPGDWSPCPLGDLFSFSNGINADKSAYGHGIPFINVLEPITYSHVREIDIPGKVSVSDRVAKIYSVKYGDIIFNRTSEVQEEVGLAAVYIGENPVVFGGFVIRARPARKILHPIYVGYALRAPAVRSQIVARGQGAIRSNVGQESLRGVLVPIPQTSEQHAIATALSDVDALIESFDRLIAKKRAVKQGAMQQLLTGRKRLPGFGGEWETKQLRDVCEIHKKGITPNKFISRLFAHFSLPAFDENRAPVIELGTRIGSNKFEVPCNAVLVSKLNPRLPRIWLPKWTTDTAVASTEFLVLTPKPEVSREFLYIVCSSPFFCDQMEQAATGTTGSHQRVSPYGAMTLEISLPIDEAEQAAIAAVLSDMDAEIEALESRRAKARQIKQGMMQQLLTGRVRLVKPEAQP